MLDAIVTAYQAARKQTTYYLDVFTFIRPHIDIWSRAAVEVSHRLLHVQKWIERQQIFTVLDHAQLRCDIYGGFQASYESKNRNSQISFHSPWLQLHGFLDKHQTLPQLYASTDVHLCCTQFPRAAHERLFQAAATGAFLLHEAKADVPPLFEPGHEVILYESLDALPDLIRYYQTHEAERRAIAKRAYRRFHAEHTPLHRARHWIRLVHEALTRRRDGG